MLAFIVILIGVVPGVARAVTIDDIVALSKAGLADPVLVAVIDADRTVFTLTPEQVVELRNAGVSNAVLVKMLGSAREFATPPPDPPSSIVTAEPAPSYDGGYAANVGGYAATTIVVPYYVPIAVPMRHARGDRHSAANAARRALPPTASPTDGFGRFINDGWIATTPTPQTQTRTTPPPIRTMPPPRETPPPLR